MVAPGNHLMRFLFRASLGVAALCIALIVVTLTFSFLRKSWFGDRAGRQAHVAVMDLTGMIVSASDTLRELEKNLKNPGVKAIVLRINSPGGFVAPSQEIYEAFREADKKVPVIASMGTVAASGGYYAAMAARKIFADAGTFTASIGVIMEFANTEKLYQWAKVGRFNIKSGKFKDAGTPLRPMTAEEHALFTNIIMDVYSQFRGVVKERRKLSETELDGVADGRVLTGRQALAARLVDSLGGFQDAVKEAKRQAKLDESAEVVFTTVNNGLLGKLLFGDSESKLDRLGAWLEEKIPTPLPASTGWRVMLLAPVR